MSRREWQLKVAAGCRSDDLLTMVCAADNKITDEGVARLAAALEKNASVTKIRLSSE